MGLVASLKERVKCGDNTTILEVWQDASEAVECYTPRALDAKSDAWAAELETGGYRGTRIALMLGSSAEFVVAVYACLKAGVVFVPLPDSVSKRKLSRVLGVLEDAQVSAVWVREDVKARVEKVICEVPVIVSTNLGEARDVEDHGHVHDNSQLACLQYTSGSTGAPKGVMLTEDQFLIQAGIAWRHSLFPPGEHKALLWLPLHHDFGLNMLFAMCSMKGCGVVLLPPEAFVRRPIDWLHAMKSVRADLTFMPNFALDLCVASSIPERTEASDLSHIQGIMSGAEAIIPESVRQFEERLAAFGLQPGVVRPGYGLAEATLAITGVRWGSPNRFEHLAGRERTSNGNVVSGVELAIVDPSSCMRLPDGAVGEVWAHSEQNFGLGYWRDERRTDEVFKATMTGSDKRWMRTGDLGVLRDGELFITGRLKSVIIINGVNHHAEDIEAALRVSLSDFCSNSIAAFPIEGTRGDELGIALEVSRDAVQNVSGQEWMDEVQSELSLTFQLAAARIAFLRPGQISRTSSGKIQRSLTRDRLLEGRCDVLYEWQSGSQNESWALEELSSVLKRTFTEADLTRPMAELHLQSIEIASLAGALSERFGKRIYPSDFESFDTFQALLDSCGE